MDVQHTDLTPAAGAGPPQAGASPLWREKMAELAAQNREARAGLVESVARRRAFDHLAAEYGTRPEQCPKLLEKVTGSYLDGSFFLENLSLYYDISPELSLTVFNLRQEWMQQYGLVTVPELMLLDQAMLAYLNVLRLHKEIAGTMSLTESQLFFADPPAIKIKKENKLREFDGLAAEDAIRELQRRLMPLIERFNKMFLQNLRALREIKNSSATVSLRSVGQLNVGQQQVNVAQQDA